MMNINRDYLIINDVKKSNIKLDNGSMFFYITDKNTQNIFVNLVINISNNDLIQKYANIENAEDYTLTMNIVKPDNTYKVVEGKLHDKEKAIFEFDLKEDCVDKIGPYRCELLTKCTINGHEEITTSNKITYKVKSSILNDLDNIVEAPEYPLVIQLFDKLSDIEQYEEDRRANELARQLAEEQRQTRFNALDADMTDSIQAIDNKVMDVENRVSIKEQAVDKLIVDTKADIDNYKVAKDQEIDEYKAAKDTEINNAITAQDNKIDTAISEQNNRITVVENDVVAQNTRLDAIEAKNQQQDDRLLDIEKVNKRQDMDLKCLFAESKNNMIDIAEEGNSIYLQNSTIGYTLIDEIKGNTLVNCNKEPNKELILNGNINTQGDNNITITEGVAGGLVDVALEGNTLVNVSKTKDTTALPLDEELTYLYANTQYTVQFVSDKATTADVTLGGASLLAQNIVKGLNRISITTPSELIDNKLVISGVGANISKVVVTDTDREFGYFEGMKSVGECENNKIEILSQNKNLFDINSWKGATVNTGQKLDINNNTVTILGYNSDIYTRTGASGGKTCSEDEKKYLIKVKPNTAYTFSTEVEGEASRTNYIQQYDENYENLGLISYGSSTNDKITFTTKSSCKYIGFRIGIKVKNATLVYSNILLEEGSQKTNYVNCNINKKEIPLNEPLRGLPNGVKDRFVLIDRKWYIERNCRVRAYQEGDEGDYKTNLVNTVYPLASPQYEPIDYNPFEVYSDITYISVNSTIPTNITVKNHGYNCLLKPSTTYTISSNLGLNTVTTPAELTEDCLRFYDTDTSDVTTMRDVLVLEGNWTSKVDLIPANFSGIESAFEQEYDTEKGKYKVNVKVANEDKTKENNITFYINEPLRGVRDVKDKVYIKDDKVVVQRNCGIRAYEDGDFGTYLTDKVNTVYALAEPIYEEVEHNDVKLFIESFKNSTLFYNSNIPVTSKLYYSYSVPIVDTVAQTADVTDQQDSMIIDLATSVAVMEMMLM